MTIPDDAGCFQPVNAEGFVGIKTILILLIFR
jgi:hypothetical protein